MSEEQTILKESCGEENLGSGDLVLTNKSLRFEKGGGFMSKKKTAIVDVPLANISKIMIEHLAVSMLTVEVNNPGLKQYRFLVKKPSEWEKAIKDAVQQLKG